jgi:hypothetical protein
MSWNCQKCDAPLAAHEQHSLLCEFCSHLAAGLEERAAVEGYYIPTGGAEQDAGSPSYWLETPNGYALIDESEYLEEVAKRKGLHWREAARLPLLIYAEYAHQRPHHYSDIPAYLFLRREAVAR